MSVALPRQFIGSVKGALKDLFTGPKYAAALQAATIQAGDGVPLPALERVYTANKDTREAYPCLELLGDVSQPNDDSSVEDYEHRLELWFWVNGDDEELITAQLERYVLAARDMLRLASLMPSVANVPVRVGREEFSPVGRAKAAPQTFLKVGVLEVFIGTLED